MYLIEYRKLGFSEDKWRPLYLVTRTREAANVKIDSLRVLYGEDFAFRVELCQGV